MTTTLDNCTGRRLVSRLRFKPTHAVEAQEARRRLLEEQADGKGFQVSEEELAAPLPETFNDRLKKAISSLEERVSSEAPLWLRGEHAPLDPALYPACDLQSDSRDDDELELIEDESTACFDVFVDEVKQIVFSYVVDRATEKEAAFHKRLTERTHNYLQDIVAARDQLAPHLRTVDVTCPDEDLPLYKTLERWDEDQQEVMKEIIEERLRQLLTLHQLRQTPEVEEEEAEEEEVVEEVVQVKEEFVEDEGDPEAEQKARDAELAEAEARRASLQTQNAQLQKMVDELQAQLEALNAETDQLNAEAKKLQEQLAAPDQPIVFPDVIRKKSPTAAQPALAPVVKRTKERPRSVVKAKDAEEVEENDYEGQAGAEKALFDEELARLLKEAQAKNASAWKTEKDKHHKRIAALEKELAMLEKMLMEQNASRISTELPSEPSESLEALSVPVEEEEAEEEREQEEEEEQEQEEREIEEEPEPSEGSPKTPTRPSVVKKKQKSVVISGTVFPVGVTRKKEAVFDQLFTQAEEKKEKLEELRRKTHVQQMEDFQRTFQPRATFGGNVPMDGLSGDMGAPYGGSSPGMHNQAGPDAFGAYYPAGGSGPGMHYQPGPDGAGMYSQPGGYTPGMHYQAGPDGAGMYAQPGGNTPGMHYQAGPDGAGMHYHPGASGPGMPHQAGPDGAGMYNQTRGKGSGMQHRAGPDVAGMYSHPGGKGPGMQYQAGAHSAGMHYHPGGKGPGMQYQAGPDGAGMHYHPGGKGHGMQYQVGPDGAGMHYHPGGSSPGMPYQAGPDGSGMYYNGVGKGSGMPYQAGADGSGMPYYQGASSPGMQYQTGPDGSREGGSGMHYQARPHSSGMHHQSRPSTSGSHHQAGNSSSDMHRHTARGGAGTVNLKELTRAGRAQSEGQLRVRLRGPLPALVDWQDSQAWRLKDEGSKGGLTGRSSTRSSKKAAKEEKPYDILKPTLRQVDAHCKMPTALARMASGSPDAGPAAEIAAGADGRLQALLGLRSAPFTGEKVPSLWLGEAVHGVGQSVF